MPELTFSDASHQAEVNNVSTDGHSSMNGVHAQDEASGYKILPQYHSKPSYLRVVCAGAGAAGILVAYKMQKAFQDYDLVCYDKNPEIGGTWYENRYPGCACDLPAHAYVYPFEPNPDWSKFYAGSAEILQYFKDFVAKHKLERYIKLNSRILSATWSEEEGIYEVEVESEGRKFKDWCHVFVNGSGFLNDWKWPQIPGLHSFKGTLLHSAAWDEAVSWDGKRVAVIGTGSSAIQIVPQMQKTAKELVAFMRNPTWIYPAVALDMLEEQKAKTEGAVAKGGEEQYTYTEEEKQKFRDDPEHLLAYRKNIEVRANDNFGLFTLGGELTENIRDYVTEEMLRRIGAGHEDLKEKIIPKFTPGCRRMTPGDGYLEALTQPNVKRVHREISKIVPEGLVDEAGDLHEVDIIVCATGFNIAFAPNFTVKGAHGVDMAEEFNPVPKVYLALTVPKFPNYFVVNGVRGNWAAGSVLVSHDIQVDYIMKCLHRIQGQGIKALEVKMEPVDQLYEHIDEYHKTSVWNDNCSSWYKAGIKDGKIWIWGGSGFHYFKTVKDVCWEHYDFRYKHKNLWSYLGDGWTEAQHARDKSRLAPYVRNGDHEWDFQDLA